MKRYTVRNIVNEDGIGEGDIVVDDATIAAVEPPARDGRGPVYEYAVPSFIDMHTHGAMEADVMDGTAASFSRIARFHRENGVAAFLGSTMTAPLERLADVLEEGRRYMALNRGSHREGKEALLMGFHLEGPWISVRNAGAHDAACIIRPDAKSLEFIERFADVIAMVTFSYEGEASEALLRCLRRNRIIAAAGHDDAVDRDILDGFSKGITCVTHLYSCTSMFTRRDGEKRLGTLETALMTDGVAVEVIADGHHITRHFWDFIRHCKKTEDIIIVSDSIRAAGLPEDPARVYETGGSSFVVDGGVARVPDGSLYAGSTATMHGMFRRLVLGWGTDIRDAVRMTSSNQARLLGREGEWGRIAAGRKADLLLLNGELAVLNIVTAGREAGATGNEQMTEDKQQ